MKFFMSAFFNIVSLFIALFSDTYLNGLISQKSILIFKVLAISVLCFSFFRFKKKSLNLLVLLNTMALNNKLHPIRALVIIFHKRIKEFINLVTIKKMVFSYSINNTRKKPIPHITKTYDIGYQLDFLFKMNMLNHFFKRYPLEFCIISESDCLEDFTIHERIDSSKWKPVPSTRIEVKSMTINGDSHDNIKKYAGLQKVKYTFPSDLSMSSSMELRISYTIKDNLTGENGAYNFSVIPYNYSYKVKEIEIKVSSYGLSLNPLVLQEISATSEETKEITDFEIETNGRQQNCCINGIPSSIKPKMHSVYFVHFDYTQLKLLRQSVKRDK